MSFYIDFFSVESVVDAIWFNQGQVSIGQNINKEEEKILFARYKAKVACLSSDTCPKFGII